jgi:hypothetical protein
MMNSVAALFVLYHVVVEITHHLTTPSPQKKIAAAGSSITGAARNAAATAISAMSTVCFEVY